MKPKIDVDRMMAEIRRVSKARRRPDGDAAAEAPLAASDVSLQRLIDESQACIDLYEKRGMAPSRFWIPWPIRPLLVATLRYFLNWQVHWNGVTSRALGAMLRLIERIERRGAEARAGTERRLQALERRLGDLDGRRETPLAAQLEFEDAHRGSEAEIRRRLATHVERFRALIVEPPRPGGERGLVADLGCGRGELLEGLRDAGIRARGIDVHPDAVQTCRAKGLDCVEADLFDWLEETAPRSLAGVAACQVVEHLTFDELLELLARVALALAPGAPLVLETVNPENLVVAAHTFHLDPSHRLKLPAPTLCHLLRAFGFEIVDVAYLNPCDPEQQLRMLPDGDPHAARLNENLLRINHLLFGPRDYAVVARRPAEGSLAAG